MPFPIIAYALAAAAVAATGAAVAYFSSDEEEKKSKPSSKPKSKARTDSSSFDYHKRGDRKRKLAKFDRELTEYIKNEKTRLTKKYGINKACIIDKSMYRVEVHPEELFEANKRAYVSKLKNEISEIDETIINLKEWRSKYA